MPKIPLPSVLKKWGPALAGAGSAVAAFLLRLPHIGRLGLWMDEGFYYLAAQKIIEHGYPLYPSGHVLYKGILYSYGLAVVGLFAGVGETAFRVFSVALAAATVPLFYLLARRFTGAIAAAAAAVILFFSVWETEYARLILYYAPLQLIYVAGLYAFVRGYFEERRRARTAALVLFLLAPHVHQLAMGLIFCFPALLIARGARRFFRKDVLIPFAVVTLNALAIQVHEMFFWKVGFVYEKTPSSLGDAVRYFFTSFSLDYAKEIYKAFPTMTILVFAGLFLLLGETIAGRGRADEAAEGRRRWLFLTLGLIFPLLFFGIFRTHVQPRYLFQVHPVFILLFVIACDRLVRALVGLARDMFGPEGPPGRVLRAATAVMALGLAALAVDHAGPSALRSAVDRAYREPISADIITRSGRTEHEDARGPGLYVRGRLRPGDTVVAMNMVFQTIYAGRTDFWLWTGGPGTWDAWEAAADGWRDVYVGARWINSLDGFKEILERRGGGRVWLITSPSIRRRDHIAADLAHFILGQADKLVFRGKDGVSEVYLWDPDRAPADLPPLEAEWLPLTFGRIVDDPGASRGVCLELDPARDGASTQSFPLDAELEPGTYRLGVMVRRDSEARGDRAFGLAVEDGHGAGLGRGFAASGSLSTKGYEEFSVLFSVPRPGGLRLALAYAGTCRLRLDAVRIRPVRAD